LVEKVVGGVGGGGAQLSAAGRLLLEAADRFIQARAGVLAALGPASDPALPTSGLLGLGLRTSMRNQLPCKVQSLHRKGNTVRVALRLAQGTVLHSRITIESAELLGLRPELPVIALCKATAVTVAQALAPREGSNMLAGTVNRASASGQDTEVSLELMPGLYLIGFADRYFDPPTGEKAMACVDEAAVVIAVGG
jgi:molybdate transport system regulatory protein